MISKKDAENIALRRVAARLANAIQRWDVPWPPRAIERPSDVAFSMERRMDVPAWYVRTPWFDGQVGVRSSRVLVISKADAVCYSTAQPTTRGDCAHHPRCEGPQPRPLRTRRHSGPAWVS
jgi:hypothetical protein